MKLSVIHDDFSTVTHGHFKPEELCHMQKELSVKICGVLKDELDSENRIL